QSGQSSGPGALHQPLAVPPVLQLPVRRVRAQRFDARPQLAFPLLELGNGALRFRGLLLLGGQLALPSGESAPQRAPPSVGLAQLAGALLQPAQRVIRVAGEEAAQRLVRTGQPDYVLADRIQVVE